MSRLVWGVFILSALCLSPASATAVHCDDQSASPDGVGGNNLQSYINLTSGCILNNTLFTNFKYSYAMGNDGFPHAGKDGLGSIQTASNVIVTADAATNRFTFGGDWVVDHYQTATLTLSFDVYSANALIDKIQNLFVSSANGTDNGGPTGSFCATTGGVSMGGVCNPTDFTNTTVSIAGTNGPITITNHVEMNARGSALGTLNQFHVSVIKDLIDPSVAAIPEPITPALVAGGLGILAFFRRRR